MIACRDCKFYRFHRTGSGLGGIPHECMRKPINSGHDVITGEPVGQPRNAALERIVNADQGCGIDAQYFQLRRRWWQIFKGE